MAFIALCLCFVLGLVIECYCFVWWFWVIVVLDILVVWCDYGYLAGVGWACCGVVLVAVVVGWLFGLGGMGLAFILVGGCLALDCVLRLLGLGGFVGCWYSWVVVVMSCIVGLIWCLFWCLVFCGCCALRFAVGGLVACGLVVVDCCGLVVGICCFACDVVGVLVVCGFCLFCGLLDVGFGVDCYYSFVVFGFCLCWVMMVCYCGLLIVLV